MGQLSTITQAQPHPALPCSLPMGLLSVGSLAKSGLATSHLALAKKYLLNSHYKPSVVLRSGDRYSDEQNRLGPFSDTAHLLGWVQTKKQLGELENFRPWSVL